MEIEKVNNKTLHSLCSILLGAYLDYSLKPMSQKYHFLFIAILCAKMSCVTWAFTLYSIDNKGILMREILF